MKYRVWANETMERIINKLYKTAPEIGARYPHAIVGGKYNEMHKSFWTNGFWPGILWLAYQETKDEKFSSVAQEIEGKLESVLEEFDSVDHDAGFIWLLSSGVNHFINKEEKSRRSIMKAASFLSSRFNLKGQYIRAWNHQPGYAIIDCSMNLPLLYRASAELDDDRFRNVAIAHAETVLKYFIREDGSVNHIVEFDTDTGEFKCVHGGQGNAPDSAWSRGTAWALYGLALAYRHLNEEKYLDASKKVADFFIANLPEDMVSHWDFRVERKEDTPRDTSASACAACGMLELADLLGEEEGKYYKEKAYLILRSLTDNYSNLDNDSDQSLITGGTGHFPGGWNINTGLIYGDYFYMEAISRLKGNKDIFWYSKWD